MNGKSKRPRDEDGESAQKNETDEEGEESRAGAIHKKVKSDPFAAHSNGKKKKKKKGKQEESEEGVRHGLEPEAGPSAPGEQDSHTLRSSPTPIANGTSDHVDPSIPPTPSTYIIFLKPLN